MYFIHVAKHVVCLVKKRKQRNNKSKVIVILHNWKLRLRSYVGNIYTCINWAWKLSRKSIAKSIGKWIEKERMERLERNRGNFLRNRPLLDSAKEVMQVSGLLLREIHPHARRGLHVCTGNDNSRSEKSRTLLLRDTPISSLCVCVNLERKKEKIRSNLIDKSIEGI